MSAQRHSRQEAAAMTLRLLLAVAICCVAICLTLPGCHPGGEQFAPVKGKVLYKGLPLPGGTIVFIPDGSRGSRGNMAIGDIQPDGTYSLKTADVLGAVPGHHKVTVSCVQPGTAYSILPPKYRDPNHSGLTREVVGNKTNVIDIQIE
jgi:hypothetical protein